jgi:hypothetical protein
MASWIVLYWGNLARRRKILERAERVKGRRAKFGVDGARRWAGWGSIDGT